MEKSPVVAIAKKVCPAVINIVISKDMPIVEGFYTMPFGGQEYIVPKFDKHSKQKVKIGGGSGFIVSPDGVVLTNAHVVEDPDAEYMAILDHGEDQKFPIKILARDRIHDIAILKIDAKDIVKEFPYIELGDSSQLELGEDVIAVGYALGEFRNTVSTGVVSGLSRFIQAQTGMARHTERLRGLIQTDAAINPGNSGGPLVNMEGKVIGISTAVVFGAQNIGFAIPINNAALDLAELKKFGHVRQPFFGVRYIIIDEMVQKQNKLPIGYGAMIVRETLGEHAVVPGSSAAKAGLKEFDIILECDGIKITTENTVQDVVSKHKVSDTLKCKILRNGRESEINVKLEDRK